MIKLEEKIIGEREIEQCKNCGLFFTKGSKLYVIEISPMDEIAKEMRSGATFFQLCENCKKELKSKI